GPWTLDAEGGMGISSLAGLYVSINGVTLNNHADATWTGAGGPGNIRASNGAAINNLAGATFTAQGGAGINWDTSQPGPAPAFNNAGSFIRSGDTGTTAVNIPFNNTGSVAVQAGALQLGATGYSSDPISTSTGSFTGAAGTTLSLFTEDLTA